MKSAWPIVVRSARRLLDILPAERPRTVSRILLLETFGVKDAVAATPALDALRQSFPTATITIAATPASCEILKNDSRISETIALAAPWVFAAANRKAFAASVARLVAKPFDIAIDLDDSPGNRLLLGMVAAPVRIGYPGKNDFALTHRATLPTRAPSLSERKMHLAIKAGAQSLTTLPSLQLTPGDQRYVEDLLSGLDLANRPLVAISADTADRNDTWSDERFAELGDRIREAEPRAQILFFGAPRDNQRLERVSNKMKKTPSVLLLSMPRLAAFFSRCDLYIGTHSGPSFIAAAFGIRSVLAYRKDQAHLAPMGPHIRLLTTEGDLGAITPALVAQSAAQTLAETPLREARKKTRSQNLYFHAMQEAPERVK